MMPEMLRQAIILGKKKLDQKRKWSEAMRKIVYTKANNNYK